MHPGFSATSTMPSPPSASSGSAEQPAAAPVYKRVFPLDSDYSIDHQCRVSDRSVQTFNHMPEFLMNKETFVKGRTLPKTNLEQFDKPPGLSARDLTAFGRQTRSRPYFAKGF